MTLHKESAAWQVDDRLARLARCNKERLSTALTATSITLLPASSSRVDVRRMTYHCRRPISSTHVSAQQPLLRGLDIFIIKQQASAIYRSVVKRTDTLEYTQPLLISMEQCARSHVCRVRQPPIDKHLRPQLIYIDFFACTLRCVSRNDFFQIAAAAQRQHRTANECLVIVEVVDDRS